MAPAAGIAPRLDRSKLLRCPGCGQRLSDPAPPRCPLCDLDFGDDRVTDVDTTPYARAYAGEDYGWLAMLNWVWYARTERLKHLALMRSSAASRQFRLINLAILAAMLGVFIMTQAGWRRTFAPPVANVSIEAKPQGDGWRRVSSLPRPLPTDLPPDRPVDLWWNPAQFGLALAIGVPGAFVGGFALLTLLRLSFTMAHQKSYRRGGRMTAAVHYSTAWFVPLGISAIILLLLPVTYVADLQRVSWTPPTEYVELAAAVFTAFGLVLWWFWFMRLGATAPPRTRWRVVTMMALAPPLLVIGTAVGWWYGTQWLLNLLIEKLRLGF